MTRAEEIMFLVSWRILVVVGVFLVLASVAAAVLPSGMTRRCSRLTLLPAPASCFAKPPARVVEPRTTRA